MLHTAFPGRPTRRALARAALCLAIALQAQAATAQQIRFDIAAQPLAAALDQFARQAGLQLVFSPALAQGRHAPRLQGSHDLRQALDELLRGSGLAGRIEGGTLTISAAEAAARQTETVLAAVTVRDTALADGTTEGTGSYAAGATRGATGLALSIRETPQTISVLTRTQIEDQGLNRLPDALRQVPGIGYEQHDSERYSMYARGFEVSTYLVDGLPVSSYPMGAYGLLYQSGTDMVAFDRIEVVKGATGLMRGAGLPSAGVNLIRKRPTHAFQATAQAALGSWHTGRVEADVAGPLNQAASVRGRLAVATEQGRSFIDRYRRNAASLFGAVDVDLGPRTLLSLSAQHSRSDVDGVVFGGAVPLFHYDGSRIDLPRNWSQVPGWANWNAESTNATVDLEHRFEQGWAAKLSYGRQHSDSVLQGIVWEGFVNPDGSGAFAWRDENTDRSRRETLSVNLSGPFQWLGRQHEAVFGLSRVRSRAHDDNYYDWDGYAPTDFFAEADRLPRLTREQRVWASTVDARVRETSGYGAARLRASDALALILGARVSNWSTESTTTDRLAAGPGNEAASGYRHRGVVSPYLGVVFDLNDRYSVYASYTDIFTPQNYRDRNGGLLGPVEGDAYEAGIKGEFLDRQLNATLAVFRIRQDNLGESTGEIIDGEPVYVAIEGAVATGIAAELAGRIGPGWQINAGISRHRVRDADGRPVLTASARTSFKLFTTYRLPGEWSALTLGGGLRWQSRSYKDGVGPDNDGIAGTADDRVSQGGYGIVDLMASYRFTPQLSLTLNVNNLFDKRYLTAFRQGSQYGSPRYAGATLRYRF